MFIDNFKYCQCTDSMLLCIQLHTNLLCTNTFEYGREYPQLWHIFHIWNRTETCLLALGKLLTLLEAKQCHSDHYPQFKLSYTS